MLSQIDLEQISKILEISPGNFPVIISKKPITGISTDSRYIKPGEIFVALRGDKFDGHEFAEVAVEKGATALILDKKLSVLSTNEIPQFIVNNTLKAYQQIAQWWRNQFQIPIIAVTGSVGKTTTKELIAAVLSTAGKVHKSIGNYNNEIGVPKTLLELDHTHHYGVIEMAMRAKGEISLLTEITRPTIGVITNVGTAHIGRLGSQEAIAEAKCELLAQMSQDSIAILNHDNSLLLETASTFWQGKTITYGLEGGDLSGQLINPQTLRVEGKEFPLPLPGRHNALNYLAALAVAKVLDLDWTPLTEGLTVNLPSGRSRRHQLPNNILILDETYNAGLESMLAALQLLKETPGKRHIAVLGTMKELGERSPQFHHQVGKAVKDLGIDHLVVLVNDPQAEHIAAGADGVATSCFKTHQEVVNYLQGLIKSGDRILFKASNSVELNRVVNDLINSQEI
ncbi:UDP-N-acetylmuramoylalanyl-D-glutamyl-2,6-diaminopimelate/D-alanyl-D-alanyl ligase [Gloeothece citriformis PCC 7424]|uniref:UDP-N-acetylmuramoyl-tripeptide--D-alanyl-D-alanine ligase n=1 Tax=Gloeothece citriformis (strain PCC 7424) TaxID=65393 RepID=B7KEX4_GLOC7|nr:UDP-N-acetylmuramoyl-tripeptide--D-alanyl-D-alanine ligase [Gloeothece citriformis]ACK70430.1 UDP-N-acetylmuramoylalanyl-D-glutamyl-2,6-diaminopimelate/D-alanyl-D-alanyl ligase [Gloeothece citriformis PCC 7424]